MSAPTANIHQLGCLHQLQTSTNSDVCTSRKHPPARMSAPTANIHLAAFDAAAVTSVGSVSIKKAIQRPAAVNYRKRRSHESGKGFDTKRPLVVT
jgi:hypothetical protein